MGAAFSSIPAIIACKYVKNAEFALKIEAGRENKIVK